MIKKTKKQIEAINLLCSVVYAAIYGGSRSGKTFIILYALCVRAFKVPSKHLIIRKTFNAVKRSIWMDTLPKVLDICFPNAILHWDRTNYILTIGGKSQIWLAGLDNAKAAEKILGQEFSTIYFNEASEFGYDEIQVVLSRLAEKNDLKKKVWFDFNPPKKTHFSYDLFINKLNPLDGEPLKNPEDYGYLKINPTDNMENIDENYLAILESMPEEARERFLNGEFADHSDGEAYYAFQVDTHVKPIQWRKQTTFAFMDFNVDPMTCVIAQHINGQIQCIDEIFLRNSDTFKMCNEIKKKGYLGARVIPDSTGRNRKTSGKSDFDIIRSSGFTITSNHNPFVTDRVNNVNRLLSNEKILIDPKCKKLINDLSKVSWKDNKLDQKTDKLLTHISDALGYGCHSLEPFISKSNLKPTMGRR